MGILLSMPILVFMAAQGAVIFLTARWALQSLRLSHWAWKIAAMIVSAIAWIAFTITTYILLGGEGGLMDGFGFVLILCFMATISAFVYLLFWLACPSRNEPEEEILIEPSA